MSERLKRLAIVVLLILAITAGSLLILLETATFQQWLLSHVENIANAAGYSVSAKKLNLSLWDLEASLEGLRFDDRKGTRITVERFSIDIPWNALSASII